MDVIPTNMEIEIEEDDETQEIQKLANMAHSMFKSVQFEGIVGIRRILMRDNLQANIQKIVDTGIVLKLLEMMTWEDQLHFQNESAWSITNICAGDDKFTHYIVELGGLDIIVNLLDSSSVVLLVQVISAIRNILSASTSYRDMLLERDCMSKILRVLKEFPFSANIRENIIYTIASFIKKTPPPAWDKIVPALPLLQNVLSGAHSQETLENVLWGLHHISTKYIQEVIDQGFAPLLVQHLQSNIEEIFEPSMRTLGNLIAGDTAQVNEVLKSNEFLPRIFQLTLDLRTDIKRISLWIISNLAAGGPEYIDLILQNTDFVANLRFLVASAESQEIVNDVVWIIWNMISNATPEQLHLIVTEYLILQSFTHTLIKLSPELKDIALRTICHVLLTGGSQTVNKYAKFVVKAKLIEPIQNLAEETDEDYWALAYLILQYKFYIYKTKNSKDRQKEENKSESMN